MLKLLRPLIVSTNSFIRFESMKSKSENNSNRYNKQIKQQLLFENKC